MVGDARRLILSRTAIAGIVACALVASTAAAQVAGSPNFVLDGLELSGPADGLASPGHAAFVSNEPAGEQSSLASPSYRVEVGFVRVHNPIAGAGPAILSVSPEHGSFEGGVPVTIQGIGFDQGGLAGSVTASIDGVPLTNQVVVSDTTITGDAPAGAYGPKPVDVTTSQGFTLQGNAYVHSPGLVLSPVAFMTGKMRVRNFGPPGSSYQTWFSIYQTSIPLPPYGILEIGPSPIVALIESGVYGLVDGIEEILLPVPTEPILAGSTFYAQSVAVLSLMPLDIRLVNSASITIF